MKTSIKTLLTLATLLGASQAFALETANRAWIAKETGELQCYANTKQDVAAGREELEEAGIKTLRIVVSGMKDEMQCSACGCLAGKYFVAQVELSGVSEEELTRRAWKVVNPSNVSNIPATLESLEEVGAYKILPVIIDR